MDNNMGTKRQSEVVVAAYQGSELVVDAIIEQVEDFGATFFVSDRLYLVNEKGVWSAPIVRYGQQAADGREIVYVTGEPRQVA